MIACGPVVSDAPATRRGVPMCPNALLFGVRGGLLREGEPARAWASG